MSLGRRQRATGRQEKCFLHAPGKMGKNKPREPDFEVPAHSTQRERVCERESARTTGGNYGTIVTYLPQPQSPKPNLVLDFW